MQLEIEQFMVENLNEHRKGLLGKTVPIGNMLAWTKASKHSVALLLYFVFTFCNSLC